MKKILYNKYMDAFFNNRIIQLIQVVLIVVLLISYSDHTHRRYADENHSHNYGSNSYADENHTHSDYECDCAKKSHTHYKWDIY